MLARILTFLLGAVADFFTFMLLARFLMQAFRVSFANPVGQTVAALTGWAVLPLRRVIPGLFGLDLASLLPAWVLQVALIVLAGLLRSGDAASLFGGLLPAALALGAVDVLRVGVYVLIVALFAAAVISWVSPWSPLAGPIMQLTRPILKPIQRIVPPLSRIDLSPLIAILLLQVVLMLLDGLRGSVLGAFLA